MKKLILTATLLSVNAIAFGQFENSGNIFNNKVEASAPATESSVPAYTAPSQSNPSTFSQTGSSTYAVAALPPNNYNPPKNCEEARANLAFWQDKNNPDKLQMAQAYVAQLCGNEPTVSIDNLTYPLIASALFFIVAYRRRIAGVLS